MPNLPTARYIKSHKFNKPHTVWIEATFFDNKDAWNNKN